MSRPGVRAAAGSRGRLAALAAGAVLAAGCAGLLETPLDVPPGHQVVVGEVFVAGFSEPEVALDIVREDGTYRTEIAVDAVHRPFVITLPRGRYQITRLRTNDSGRTLHETTSFQIGATFEVGDSAVYVGTLQIERVVFARQVRVEVRDEYERTVPAVRSRYPDLPPLVTRAVMRTT